LNPFAIEGRSLKSKINCGDSADTVTYCDLYWVSIQLYGFQTCWSYKWSISWMTINTLYDDFGSKNRNGANVWKSWSIPVSGPPWRSILLHTLKSLVTKTTLSSSFGRPSIDPVVFFKFQLVAFFEGIRSERLLMETVSLNLAHRWFIGYDLDEDVPDHSILKSYGRKMKRNA
jgi:hypothetical protein